MKCTLVKYTILAALDGDAKKIHLEDVGDRLAETLRQEDGVLTVGSEYDSADAEVDGGATDDDVLVDALARQFPTDGLFVGPVPGAKVLGRNGTFKRATLKRNGAALELWLGTEKERFPLVSIPAANEDADA